MKREPFECDNVVLNDLLNKIKERYSSICQFSIQIRVSKQFISSLLKGKTKLDNVSAIYLIKISQGLDLTLEQLLKKK